MISQKRIATRSPRSTAAGAMLLAVLLAPLAAAQSPLSADDLRDGTDYRAINPPQSTSTDAGQVEVAEIFQYGCPYCFTFEPMLEEWLEQKADYVNFVRLPAAWNAAAEIHARAYYTAEALDKLDEMHLAFFNEIHNEGNTLTSEDALAEFFGRYGVDEQTFKRTFNSFSINTKVARADELIRRYRVGATPNIVVEGKYLTDGSMAGSFERWFEIIDALAEREHEAAD